MSLLKKIIDWKHDRQIKTGRPPEILRLTEAQASRVFYELDCSMDHKAAIRIFNLMGMRVEIDNTMPDIIEREGDA
jgi:hypothetical protein